MGRKKVDMIRFITINCGSNTESFKLDSNQQLVSSKNVINKRLRIMMKKINRYEDEQYYQRHKNKRSHREASLLKKFKIESINDSCQLKQDRPTNSIILSNINNNKDMNSNLIPEKNLLDDQKFCANKRNVPFSNQIPLNNQTYHPMYVVPNTSVYCANQAFYLSNYQLCYHEQIPNQNTPYLDSNPNQSNCPNTFPTNNQINSFPSTLNENKLTNNINKMPSIIPPDFYTLSHNFESNNQNQFSCQNIQTFNQENNHDKDRQDLNECISNAMESIHNCIKGVYSIKNIIIQTENNLSFQKDFSKNQNRNKNHNFNNDFNLNINQHQNNHNSQDHQNGTTKQIFAPLEFPKAIPQDSSDEDLLTNEFLPKIPKISFIFSS
ncbi:hypothetical protein TRFO_39145 [Tritrichomonas foetus]|uniref:Uncharacterized protein n=1 Tax=Tritrichomonas foetus TaxID=1144522 RepID=A0A1J4JB69_9EUKA|nr:hypothetical protein TRFO_39145 [Tritrichomonas foetus]|eukprot:OHS94677.1 hypothetical protein TRFO_39145 [Tritrichomonas foetus]